MGARDRRTRGQSIVEYLVIAAIIIVAVLGIGTGLKAKVENMGDSAESAIGAVTDDVDDKLKYELR